MSSLNSCQFIGNLGADVEVRSFQNGGRVANLRIACTEKWKDREGNRKEKTEWVSVAIFNDGLVGIAERYLRKGSKVYVSGKMSTRKYQAQDGSDRYTTEIVLNGFDAKLILLDGAQSGGGSRGDGVRQPGDRELYNSGRGGWQDGAGSTGGGFGDDLDDDLPF
jgi:single-strand DNA-binding protein